MKRALILAVALPALAGCSLFRADPVPPEPALTGVRAQDAAWASQIKRSPEGGSPTFAPLVDAREAVSDARAQAGVEDYDADSLRSAERALDQAEAGWRELADKKRRAPSALAAVADDAHRAQRLAEIAHYTAAREIDLDQLTAANQALEAQQERAAAAAARTRGGVGAGSASGGGSGLIGQRVVPDRFGDISFQTGTARMTDGARGVVAQLAALMRANGDTGVAVLGHTDNVAPAERTLDAFVEANPELEEQAPDQDEKVRAFNLALSAARARAVAQALVDQGVPARRIGARGFGDTRPVAPNDTAEGRAANRRIEAVIIPGPDDPNSPLRGGQSS